jgi:uroporphyrin-III C-methyltransferase
MKGKVYLVGAGPGDPELLTLKALRLLRTADAVLHDDLVAPEILKLIPPAAQIYNVGKRCGKKKIVQGEINGLMVALAASGLRVVRLKGGDPLIFGRAGEEIESLRRSKIPFEIVPGVTSALGAAAAAQIPLTHRRASSALVLITGHRASENRASERRVPEEDATDWSKFVASGATLVIYMPGQDYSDIARRLMAAGLAIETPCAIISRATTRQQRTHRTTVLDLHRAPQLAAPTLLVVGEVVGLADPAAMVDELVVPGLAPMNDSLLPAAIVQSIPLGDATPGSR